MLVTACMLLHACASIPRHEYGVESLRIQGAKQMDEEAIKVCLATQARERTGFTLGAAGDPECGVPPFDATRWPVALWAWPWTSWPTYDEAVFDRDVSRVERWYRARGFYDARVTQVTRKRDEAEHRIDLGIAVEEGEPVLVEAITVHGLESLDEKQRERALHSLQLEIGERFDEALYDQSKRALTDFLRDAAYAQADVQGAVQIDPKRRLARVVFEVALGRRFRFGKLSVAGQGSLPVRPILGAAEIQEGDPFSVGALEDAKRAIYELGPFASVDLVEIPRPERGVVDILVKVVPGRRLRTALGAGMQVGVDPTLVPVDAISDSLVQWDLHLLGRIEHRNFLGGMRSISIEDRPRLIFSNPFPNASTPSLGNLLMINFRQPAFIEARTSLIALGRWDRGPDPYAGRFSRSDLLAGIGPERTFLNGKLRLTATLNFNLFLPDTTYNGPVPQPFENYYPAYHVTYLQYSAVLDLRDQPREPHRGAYFGLSVQQAGYGALSDWNYVRVTPDVRGYLHLPLGMVLAARARIGIMEISSSSIPVNSATDYFGVQERLRELGPLRQRLRGGGQNSVRGYAPNELGDVTWVGNLLDSGGLRQWEASVELRAPITSSFGAVLFVDAGDVSRAKEFRFQYPQTSFGIGLRYRTIIGPVRFDMGFAPRALQTIGPGGPIRVAYIDSPLPQPFPESTVLGARGAIHFTIGEAF